MVTSKEKPPEPVPEGPMIHRAMLAIMGEIGAIEKEKTVSGFGGGYKYRGIDQVYEAIYPLMVRHGVFMTAEVLDKSREERAGTNSSGKATVTAFTSLRMRYHFRAADGSSVFTEAEGEGMDSGDKSSNKAMAVAHKYAILQAFCVPTEQTDDPDADTHQLAPRQPTKPAASSINLDVDESTMILIEQSIERAASNKDLDAIWFARKDTDIAGLAEKFPQFHTQLMAAFKKRRGELKAKEAA